MFKNCVNPKCELIKVQVSLKSKQKMAGEVDFAISRFCNTLETKRYGYFCSDDKWLVVNLMCHISADSISL